MLVDASTGRAVIMASASPKSSKQTKMLGIFWSGHLCPIWRPRSGRHGGRSTAGFTRWRDEACNFLSESVITAVSRADK